MRFYSLSLAGVLLIASLSANAGLLGFLGDVASISSAVSGSGKGVVVPDFERKMNERVQQSLELMGYYQGVIDGNLNTFESRKAIEAFQVDADLEEKLSVNFVASLMGAPTLFHTGVLDSYTKQDLLYYLELAEAFDTQVFGLFQNQTQLELILDAVLTHEERLLGDTTPLSSAMQKVLKANERDGRQVIKLKSLAERGFVVDPAHYWVWQDKELPSQEMTYGDAKQYCESLVLEGVDQWSLPWDSYLGKLAGKIRERLYVPIDFAAKTPTANVWSTDYRSSYRLNDGKFKQATRDTASVRCIYKYR